MVQGFWAQLHTPFFALAPMYDVTDAVFRAMIAQSGAPDVTFTEFVSAEGLAHPVGRDKLDHHLWYTDGERPIVAQIFGTQPAAFETAARLLREKGFDGIDINMGCPEKNVVRAGAGAALITDPALARDLVHAARAGAGDVPVSVKTRIGFARESIDTWLPHLLELQLPALTVHLRTQKEMSEVDAHWDMMPRIVAMRGSMAPQTRIVGNGDVVSRADGEQRVRQTGCDGIMIGRGVFGNPWVFTRDSGANKSVRERLAMMVAHTEEFERLFAGMKNFAIMKKHYKAYAMGFDGASALRAQLMAADDATAVAACVDDFFHHHPNV